ncbi:uncharacterized protein RJT21DRAFT_38610 [Scheffersomyces amazonensis]|uniref:uncharacterized protein n=1 Tax=Scheffersomyces amazonensis TaxID=1078765 RepID=UPI00315D0D2F
MSSDENSTSSKRTRASGEALDFLLQEFERNQNPSNEQRREISEKTGMTEKAIRIWFQNRRAKLKKFEKLSKINTNTTNTTNSSIHSSRSNSFSNLVSPNHYNHPGNSNNNNGINPPSNLSHQQLQQQYIPIEINEKYCFINCSSLSVGSWQRIKSGYHQENLLRNSLVNLSPFTLNSVMQNVDLLVILSKKNFEINYFFSAISNNTKILFRIFYPINSILTCSLLDNNINKENNELRVSLSHQPKFSVYFYNGINNNVNSNSNANQWSICDDFSEGQQVSQAHMNEGGTSIPHVLVGVKSSLQYLNAFILENNQMMHHQQQQNQQPLLDNPLLWDDPNTISRPDFIASQHLSQGHIAPNNSHPNQALPPHFHQHPSQQQFSPVGTGFDLDNSPNSITSHSHVNVNSNSNSNSNINNNNSNNNIANNNVHSVTSTPHSIGSNNNNRLYPTSNVPQQYSQHQSHPSQHSTYHDGHGDNFDIFQAGNTPDFFINNEITNTPGSNNGGGNSNINNNSSNPISYSNNNSPSMNNITQTGPPSTVHSYTHNQYPHNDTLLETLSNGSLNNNTTSTSTNNNNGNSNGNTFIQPQVHAQHLHQPSSHEFDFIGLHNDFNTPSSSNNTPGLGFDGANVGVANTSTSGATNTDGNDGNASNNIDHFIDYGSQFS